jgi:hypothetical protein
VFVALTYVALHHFVGFSFPSVIASHILASVCLQFIDSSCNIVLQPFEFVAEKKCSRAEQVQQNLFGRPN